MIPQTRILPGRTEAAGEGRGSDTDIERSPEGRGPFSLSAVVSTSSRFAAEPFTMSASPGSRLRTAWEHQTIAVPGVFCPLVAKMAERFGLRAVYLSRRALAS